MMGIWPTAKPAVLAAVTILQGAFGGYASVSTKLPGRNRPERFVKVSRVGGGQTDPATDRARILVECFGRDTATAEQMANTARAGLRNSAGVTLHTPTQSTDRNMTMFVRWYGNETGLADLPHPDILDYERFQFVGELWVKSN